MGDKKFVKLKPWKMGFEYLGMVGRKRQLLLHQVLTNVQEGMGREWDARLLAKEIFWLNLWQDEADAEEAVKVARVSSPEIAREIRRWCRKAVRNYCGRKAIMDGYGFIVNPKDSPAFQPWHIDYTTDAAVIWIPITQLTPENATEYITLPNDMPDTALEEVASYVDEVNINRLGNALEYYTISQLIAKPMSVLYMKRGTIHRGIPNRSGDHRIVFYISIHFIKDYERNYPYDADSYQGTEADVEIFRE